MTSFLKNINRQHVYNNAGFNKAGKKVKYTIDRHHLKMTTNTTEEQINSTNQ